MAATESRGSDVSEDRRVLEEGKMHLVLAILNLICQGEAYRRQAETWGWC